MNDQDYRELLRTMRAQVSNLGLGAVDERIMPSMRESDGPFWDLTFYLKHLREEIQLGSDTEYRETLRRVRRHVETESGEPVEGIRIDFSPADAERYQIPHLDIKPSSELGDIARQLDELIRSLITDHERTSDTDERRE